MKQEIRFLDCIERDFNSRKKKSIILGIISAICFLVGMMLIIWRIKNFTPNLFPPIMIIGAVIAWGPMIFALIHILAYTRSRHNRNNWKELTKKISFNKEITVYITLL